MKENTKAVKWLSAGHFVADSYSGFLNPILPFIAAKLGITMAIAALMVSASNLTASLSQPLFGFIADRWKKRFFVFWGIMLASIFLSLVGVANNAYTLAFCIVIGSIGISFFHPQATSFVPFFAPKATLSRDMSVYMAMGTLGFACGPVISSTIAEVFTLEKLPFISIIGVLFAFTMFFFLPKVSIIKVETIQCSIITAFKDMFANKIMRILLMTSILKSLVVSSFTLTLPFFWKAQGYSVSKIGIILFAFTLFGGLGTYFSSFIEKRFGAKKIFYLSMMLVFPITLVFYFCQEKAPAISLAAFLILGFLSFLSIPLNMLMAQKTMPQYNCMISGFIGGFSWGVIGLLLPIISLVAEKYGILNVLLFISSIPLYFAYFVKYLPEEY